MAVTVPDYRTALAGERAIKNGYEGQRPPRLNPASRA